MPLPEGGVTICWSRRSEGSRPLLLVLPQESSVFFSAWKSLRSRRGLEKPVEASTVTVGKQAGGGGLRHLLDIREKGFSARRDNRGRSMKAQRKMPTGRMPILHSLWVKMN